jgi:hypothetical protein
MEMTRKSVLYALAVVVLTGSMAVAALADDHGMNMYGPPDASLSADPEKSVGQVGTVEIVEIREPVETGAVPEWSLSSYDLHSNATGDEPTVEIGGRLFRPGIDDGP